MTLSTRIAPHLPYLRRFSRAVTGSQTSGDAYVAATLEALIADISLFPEASNDRIALYKLHFGRSNPSHVDSRNGPTSFLSSSKWNKQRHILFRERPKFKYDLSDDSQGSLTATHQLC